MTNTIYIRLHFCSSVYIMVLVYMTCMYDNKKMTIKNHLSPFRHFYSLKIKEVLDNRIQKWSNMLKMTKWLNRERSHNTVNVKYVNHRWINYLRKSMKWFAYLLIKLKIHTQNLRMSQEGAKGPLSYRTNFSKEAVSMGIGLEDRFAAHLVTEIEQSWLFIRYICENFSLEI